MNNNITYTIFYANEIAKIRLLNLHFLFLLIFYLFFVWHAEYVAKFILTFQKNYLYYYFITLIPNRAKGSSISFLCEALGSMRGLFEFSIATVCAVWPIGLCVTFTSLWVGAILTKPVGWLFSIGFSLNSTEEGLLSNPKMSVIRLPSVFSLKSTCILNALFIWPSSEKFWQGGSWS